ncbi:hypothetical protein BJX63DRAFT_400316 [Aspergillus granulosus]|uniref:Uncharacterized protein n=1 Tax=Aspergillus granulosus TaxID=176169 RepID=A0ABR4H6F6_9EURO
MAHHIGGLKAPQSFGKLEACFTLRYRFKTGVKNCRFMPDGWWMSSALDDEVLRTRESLIQYTPRKTEIIFRGEGENNLNPVSFCSCGPGSMIIDGTEQGRFAHTRGRRNPPRKIVGLQVAISRISYGVYLTWACAIALPLLTVLFLDPGDTRHQQEEPASE